MTPIETLHQVYEGLTRFQIRLDYTRERQWFEWQRRGFGEAELRLVVGYLRSQIRIGKRNPGALKFSNLIGNADYFEEDLQLARGAARPARAVGGERASVLRQTGRSTEVAAPPARKMAEIVGSKEYQDGLAKLRQAAEGGPAE